MQELQLFNFKGHDVSIIELNGEPWFIGKEVAEILGYSNASKAVSQHVNLKDKRFEMMAHSQNGNLSKSKTALINESGLYSLIIKSKLPDAKEFQHWVTSEVLPSIRKHGAYLTPEKLEEVLLSPDTLIKLAQNLKQEQELRQQAEAKVIEMEPKAIYYDIVLQCPDLVSATVIAKDYGKSATWLNQKLHELGVQYKRGTVWVLYQEHADKGYTASATHIVHGKSVAVYTKWTQKGRLAIYNWLKEVDILPMVERERAVSS